MEGVERNGAVARGTMGVKGVLLLIWELIDANK